jgi:hypothetical protein
MTTKKQIRKQFIKDIKQNTFNIHTFYNIYIYEANKQNKTPLFTSFQKFVRICLYIQNKKPHFFKIIEDYLMVYFEITLLQDVDNNLLKVI